MVTVGSLKVNLGLNSAGFTSGRKKASGELQALTNSVKSAQRLIAGGLAIIGASATIGAAKAFVGAQMDVIDATGKAADRLGIQTEELIAFRHAASLAGVGSEEFDKSLEKMTRSIGQAAQISGAARDALERLGLSAQDLSSKSPAKAFAEIADRIKEIKNPAERAAIAADIFGRSGQKLQNVLMGGSAALQAAREETEKLGVSFSRVDAAQVEAANDAFFRAQEVIRGAGVQLAVGLSPYLTAATNQFIEMTTAGEGVGKIGHSLEMTAQGVAVVSDYLLGAMSIYHALRYVGIQTLTELAWWTSSLAQAVQPLLGQLAKLVSLHPATRLMGQSFRDMLNDIKSGDAAEKLKLFTNELQVAADNAKAAAGDAYNNYVDGASSQSVAATFEKIRADAKAAGEAVAAAATAPIQAIDHEAQQSVDRIKSMMDGLQKELNTFSLSTGEKKLIDLEAMGASPQQLAQAKSFMASLQNLKIGEYLTKLESELSGFGSTDGDKKLFDLKALGASPEQLAQAQKMIDALDDLQEAQKRQQDMASQAKSIYDATRTPLEQYETHIGKLSDMLNSGALDWDTYGRAVKQAREELEGGSKTGRSATLGERIALSGRAGSASIGGQRAAGMTNSNGKIKVDGTDKTNRLLASINTNVSRGVPAVLV